MLTISNNYVDCYSNSFLDIDECTSLGHNCHSDAKCINFKGSFHCTCKHGYQGNGSYCEGGKRTKCIWKRIKCSFL